jgi:hypothetical protein
VGPEVQGGSTNTLKLAIADASDSAFDSWVLFEGGSLTTDPDPDPEPEPDSGTEGDNIKQESEAYIARGTLREILNQLSTGTGIPLDGDILAEEGGGMSDRNCFSAVSANDTNDQTHSVGFAWWLPVDHANEIQTDSATFDLGFYTEQCRHNDGEGMEPETTPTGTPP